MVRSRGESPATGDANLLPASVPDIGRSLKLAREQADLTVTEAALRFGLRSAALVALESGNVGLQHDRIETLRTLRTYANALGLPGDEYVLLAVEQWPASGSGLTPPHGDTAVVPVVSISTAPAGGHSPAGGGVTWPSDATGVADATTTGVFEPITRPLSSSDGGVLQDTGQVPIADTGEVPAVKIPTPRILKVLVGIVTFLIVVGGVALAEHDHIDGWAHDVRSSTAHWYDNAKVAVGITSNPKSHSATKTTTSPTTGPKVTSVKVAPALSGQAATFSVPATTFTVKILADNAPCWVQAVVAGNSRPVFGQVLTAGQFHLFTVTSSLTIQTGSGSGRVYIYKGFTLLETYVPTKVPFTMTFNAVN
jgi:hypothetical protein